MPARSWLTLARYETGEWENCELFLFFLKNTLLADWNCFDRAALICSNRFRTQQYTPNMFYRFLTNFTIMAFLGLTLLACLHSSSKSQLVCEQNLKNNLAGASQHILNTVNAEIFIGDSFSWASIPTKIKPTKICIHKESATVIMVGYSYPWKWIPLKI